MTVRVGINGFGRIGRNFFRAAKQRGVDIDFVAVNDLGSLATMAHLLKYDSVLGTLPNKISATSNGITVDGDELRVLQERDPKKLPWGELGVDVVIESTGFFTKRDTAAYHLEGGAPLVRLSRAGTRNPATPISTSSGAKMARVMPMMAEVPAASPSRPSVRLAPLLMAVIRKMTMGM